MRPLPANVVVEGSERGWLVNEHPVHLHLARLHHVHLCGPQHRSIGSGLSEGPPSPPPPDPPGLDPFSGVNAEADPSSLSSTPPLPPGWTLPTSSNVAQSTTTRLSGAMAGDRRKRPSEATDTNFPPRLAASPADPAPPAPGRCPRKCTRGTTATAGAGGGRDRAALSEAVHAGRHLLAVQGPVLGPRRVLQQRSNREENASERPGAYAEVQHRPCRDPAHLHPLRVPLVPLVPLCVGAQEVTQPPKKLRQPVSALGYQHQWALCCEERADSAQRLRRRFAVSARSQLDETAQELLHERRLRLRESQRSALPILRA
eukprot:1561581-Rhodomonas_salina.2